METHRGKGSMKMGQRGTLRDALALKTGVMWS